MHSETSYPFRLGCTSYVLPDHILPNIAFMAGKVDDIEIVLFESEDYSNLPNHDTVKSMQLIAENKHTTFSIHFPIDRKAGAIDAYEREAFLSSVLRIIKLTRILPVSGYLLHFEGLTSLKQHEIDRWKTVINDFCNILLKKSSVDPSLICVENLSYPPDIHYDTVIKYGFSHCIDLGHLWLNSPDWENHITHVLDTTRIIHLHGVEGNNDHQSLEKHSKRVQLQRLKQLFSTYTGVITLEVFGEQDTFSSLSFFEEIWQ